MAFMDLCPVYVRPNAAATLRLVAQPVLRLSPATIATLPASSPSWARGLKTHSPLSGDGKPVTTAGAWHRPDLGWLLSRSR